jgi:hypothetical protein
MAYAPLPRVFKIIDDYFEGAAGIAEVYECDGTFNLTLQAPSSGRRFVYIVNVGSGVITVFQEGSDVSIFTVGANETKTLLSNGRTAGESSWRNLSGGGTTPYTVYAGLISQSNTDDPSVTVLQNDANLNIVWTRSDVGLYVGTLVGAFPANKVLCFIGPDYDSALGDTGGTVSVAMKRGSDNTVLIASLDGGSAADTLLVNANFEIRIYP